MDKEKNIFVIMPFSSTKNHNEETWTENFEHIFKVAIEECGYSCERAIPTTGSIIKSIVEKLKNSRIVLADITDQNPNVFYELGFRHCLNKRTIIVSQNVDDIPSDLRGYWSIIYGTRPKDVTKFKTDLRRIIEEIEDNPDKSDNPVSDFLDNKNIEIPDWDQEKREMLSEISNLRKDFNNYRNETLGMMKKITSSKTAEQGKKEIGFEFFKGVWQSKESESVYYADVINNKLLIPYCYHGNQNVRAHLYNCKIIGKTLFALFQWLDTPETYGYVFYEVISKNKLVGGWCSGPVPRKLRKDISKLNEYIDNDNFSHESTPRVHRRTLIRKASIKKYPSWVEKYFQGV